MIENLRLKHKDRESLQAKRPPRTTVTGSKGIEMTSSSKLLAGYMAHEFRSKGTVLGKKLEPDTGEMKASVNGNERYKEVASLIMMKSDGGAHISGIVNPSQLARWIQM